jgi:PhnB protein
MQLNPYLYFNGDCAVAFKVYEQLLGGKVEAMMPHAGTPAETAVPKEWGEKIIHASMTVGDFVLMASDAPPGHYHAPQGFSVSLQVQTPAEAERIFQGLAEGGKVTMPLEKTFFAARFGMLTDRFGIPWMINCAPAI